MLRPIKLLTSYRLIAALAFALLIGSSPASSGADTSRSALWDEIRGGGHILLIRHALAPGTGDPENLTIGDCTTQRNLNDVGRDQARAIGDLFRVNGIASAEVYSSQWCRCLETAENMNLGTVTEQPFLNSFFQRYETRESQTQAALSWIADADLSAPTVFVTHQVNITALTGVYPASGEIVVIKRGHADALEVVGRIPTLN